MAPCAWVRMVYIEGYVYVAVRGGQGEGWHTISEGGQCVCVCGVRMT